MPSLYNCRHDGDQYRITKFDSNWNVEASYLCDLRSCECPAGHRPSCRHRQMLPKFLNRNYVGTEFFFDFDRGGWVQGASVEIEPMTAEDIEALPDGLEKDYQQEMQSDIEPSLDRDMGATHDEAIAQQEIRDGLDLLESLAPAELGQASEPKPFLDGISQSVASTMIYTTNEPPFPIVRVDLRVPVEPDPPEPTKHEFRLPPSQTIRRRV